MASPTKPTSSVESTSHLPRLFVEMPTDSETSTSAAPLHKNSLVPLNSGQEHYLLDVMRITNPKRWGKNNSSKHDYTGHVRIFNGIDGEWLARVVIDDVPPTQKKQHRRKRSGKQASGTVVECLEQLRPQQQQQKHQEPSRIDLCLGYIRDKQRRRWVFEKATELGVDSIRILETDFCHTDSSSYKKKKDLLWEEEREKHELHVVEAAEQCERLTVPEVGAGMWTVDTLSSELVVHNNNNKNDLWLVCLERSETSPPILSVLGEATTNESTGSSDGASTTTTSPSTTIHVLVGPEGGWSPRELEIFSSLETVRSVSLGSSVLRAETAAITAIASIQMHRETISF